MTVLAATEVLIPGPSESASVDQAAFIVMNAKNIVLGLSLAVLGAGVVLMCVAQHEVNELSFQIGLMLAPFNR